MALTVGQKNNDLSWVGWWSNCDLFQKFISSWVGSKVSDGGVQSFVQESTLSEEFQLF
jgi:hypothetical protein